MGDEYLDGMGDIEAGLRRTEPVFRRAGSLTGPRIANRDGDGRTMECANCGSRRTEDEIRSAGFLSCCPARKMREAPGTLAFRCRKCGAGYTSEAQRDRCCTPIPADADPRFELFAPRFELADAENRRLAALAAAMPPGWQPIETYPLTRVWGGGLEVLLRGPGWEGVGVCAFCDTGGVVDGWDGWWWHLSDLRRADDTTPLEAPTHWQPRRTQPQTNT